MYDTLVVFSIIISVSIVFKFFFRKIESILEGINAVVFNVMLPALCIKTFANTSLDYSLIYEVISAWLIIIVSLVIGFITLKVFTTFLSSIPSRDLGVLLLISGFGNVLYLGVPIITGLYGKEAIRYAVVFDFFASTIITWTIGAFIACKYGEHKEYNLKSSIKNIFTLPPVWGIAVGIVINLMGVQLDKAILRCLTMLADTVTPLMIFSIGLSLRVPTLKSATILIPFLIVKLFISPLIAFYITGLFPMGEIARKSMIMESAMPVMLLVSVVSARFRLNESLTALSITISTASSFITLPVIANILEIVIKK